MGRYSQKAGRFWIPAICCAVVFVVGYFLFSRVYDFPYEDDVNDLAIKGSNYAVFVKKGGAIALKVGKDTYTIESSFSYPGRSIGFNTFNVQESPGDQNVNAAQAVHIRTVGADQIETRGDFKDYSVTRLITLSEGKISVSETFKNKRRVPTGIVIGHTLGGSTLFDDIYLGGDRRSGLLNKTKRFIGRRKEITWSSENPTIYVKGDNSGLGIAVQDSVFRLKLAMNTSALGNKVRFGMRNFALDAEGERTFEWVLYPLTSHDDYFSFINELRRDWKTNFTIHGPFDFFDVILNKELIRKPDGIKAYLSRKCLKIIALTPWLDYTHYNFTTGDFLTREEYKSLMQNAFNAIKQADPSIKVIGCLEYNLVTLPSEIEKSLLNGTSEKKAELGIYKSSGKETTLIRKSDLKCKDSLVVTEDGKYVLELYGQMKDELKGELGDSPIRRAIAVYSARGNSQFENLMDQSRFITDDVGLDGIYIDQFSLAFEGLQRYSYEKQDGVTADIDKKTGEIVRKYTDGSFAGIGARQDLIDSILSKGKILVANTHAAVEEMQSKPVYRFLEGGRIYNPLSLKVGQEPPYNAYLAKGHLGSPIALGERHWFWGSETKHRYARYIMKDIVVFLRHGLLYYCFNTEIPDRGEGNGAYGPINHMFPITPVSLGKGFIEGKERIITSVSGAFSWRQERRPSVLAFDMEGRPKDAHFNVEKLSLGWRVRIKLNDWEEIAIVE